MLLHNAVPKSQLPALTVPQLKKNIEWWDNWMAILSPFGTDKEAYKMCENSRSYVQLELDRRATS